MTMAMGDAVSKGADGGLRFTVSDAASTSLQLNGSGTSMNNSVSSSQVLLLPVNPPEGTEP
jgi:hypothetical protein